MPGATVNDLRKLKRYRRQQKRCQKTRFAFFSNIIEIDQMLDDDDFDICIRKPYVGSVVCAQFATELQQTQQQQQQKLIAK